MSPKDPCCPPRLLLFCCNLYVGLILGQVCAELMPADVYSTWKQVIKIVTMFHLSYIMINVGFEFDLDKTRLKSYALDYLVAMTAAAFPWIFCSLYLIFVVDELPCAAPRPPDRARAGTRAHAAGTQRPRGSAPARFRRWQMALVAGRFAAPTSAGILFTMLEAAGMKETW